jgi:hypothetical protein
MPLNTLGPENPKKAKRVHPEDLLMESIPRARRCGSAIPSVFQGELRAFEVDAECREEVGLSPQGVGVLDEYRVDREHRSPGVRFAGGGVTENLSADGGRCGPAVDFAAIGDDGVSGLTQVGGHESELFGVFSGEHGAGGAGVHCARKVDLGAALSLDSHVQSRRVEHVVGKSAVWQRSVSLAGEDARGRDLEERHFGGSLAELVPQLRGSVSHGQELTRVQCDPLPGVIDHLRWNRRNGRLVVGPLVGVYVAERHREQVIHVYKCSARGRALDDGERVRRPVGPPESGSPRDDLCVYGAIDGPDVVDLTYASRQELFAWAVGYERFGRWPGKRSRANRITNEQRN